jgi:hypothetical protein
VDHKSANINNKDKKVKRIKIKISGGVSASSDGWYIFVYGNEARYFPKK